MSIKPSNKVQIHFRLCWRQKAQPSSAKLIINLSLARTIKINSPKPLTDSPEKIRPLECTLTQRAKRLSSQAWASCIWRSTLRSVVVKHPRLFYFSPRFFFSLHPCVLPCHLSGWSGNTTVLALWGSPKWRSERQSPLLYRKC